LIVSNRFNQKNRSKIKQTRQNKPKFYQQKASKNHQKHPKSLKKKNQKPKKNQKKKKKKPTLERNVLCKRPVDEHLHRLDRVAVRFQALKIAHYYARISQRFVWW
jgi:hypothetical protein